MLQDGNSASKCNEEEASRRISPSHSQHDSNETAVLGKLLKEGGTGYVLGVVECQVPRYSILLARRK